MNVYFCFLLRQPTAHSSYMVIRIQTESNPGPLDRRPARTFFYAQMIILIDLNGGVHFLFNGCMVLQFIFITACPINVGRQVYFQCSIMNPTLNFFLETSSYWSGLFSLLFTAHQFWPIGKFHLVLYDQSNFYHFFLPIYLLVRIFSLFFISQFSFSLVTVWVLHSPE